MDLGISGNVTWNPGGNGVVMSGGTGSVASLGSATKVINALQLTNTSTFEAWVEPVNLKLVAPIVSIDSGASSRNFVMLQRKNDMEIILWHTNKDNDGHPRILTSTDPLTQNLIYLVHTYDGATEKLYVDGVVHPTMVLSSGTYANWVTTETFSVGNLATLDAGWKGTVRLVAVYDRPLSEAEVQQNFAAGPTGQ